jgi:copper chaperone CopZ
MKALRYTTNINCNNCIARVTPYLDALPSIVHWEVDTTHPEKILTVYGDEVRDESVQQKVREAGYRITPLPEGSN